MTGHPIRAETIARLRANAAAAGIALTDAEVERIAAGPYFQNVETFGRLVARFPADTLPDYLKDWGERAERAAIAPPPRPEGR